MRIRKKAFGWCYCLRPGHRLVDQWVILDPAPLITQARTHSPGLDSNRRLSLCLSPGAASPTSYKRPLLVYHSRTNTQGAAETEESWIYILFSPPERFPPRRVPDEILSSRAEREANRCLAAEMETCSDIRSKCQLLTCLQSRPLIREVNVQYIKSATPAHRHCTYMYSIYRVRGAVASLCHFSGLPQSFPVKYLQSLKLQLCSSAGPPFRKKASAAPEMHSARAEGEVASLVWTKWRFASKLIYSNGGFLIFFICFQWMVDSGYSTRADSPNLSHTTMEWLYYCAQNTAHP